MRFVVLSSAPVFTKKDGLEAYPPYVKEMDIWFSKVDTKILLAPDFHKTEITTIPFTDDIDFIRLPYIEMTSVGTISRSVLRLPSILYKIYSQFRKADHIHLRCPGNMGLLGCLVQIVFPKTPKTVKYAGNWDPNAKQPWSYRLQKRILSNISLTKNCKVLVYGDWPNQTKHIIPFFTATYSKAEIEPLETKDYSSSFQFLFVGTLSKGKQPLKAIKLVERLIGSGRDAKLDLYGEGEQQQQLQQYIKEQRLSSYITLKGNQPKEIVKSAYKNSHFLILPSKSEGWPKVIAEAMFWGCIPITTPVSCVPWMLGYGRRGFLIDQDFSWSKVFKNQHQLKAMSEEAAKWSRCYTLNDFDREIAHLLKPNL